jgi:hypothetical protein
LTISRRSFLLGSASLIPSRGGVLPPVDGTVLIGDSHAYLMSRAFRDVAHAYDRRVGVLAHGGSSVRQWVVKKWVQRQVLAKYPDATLLLVSLGTNCTRVERPRLAADIKKLVTEGGLTVSWLLPPPMKADTRYLRDAVAAVPGLFPIDPGPLPLLHDGIHATPKGYYMWAQTIADTLWS